jgi:hypothetical protein
MMSMFSVENIWNKKCVILKLLFFYDCLDLLEDVDGHVEVVVLHGGGGVDGCQRGADVDHELVVESSVRANNYPSSCTVK